MSGAPIMLAADGGEHLFYDGGLLTFKATGAQTDNDLLLFEVRMPYGKATPLHVHHDADETFYVLEGEVRVHIAGTEDRSVSTGSVVTIPRGAPHAFAVTSSATRLLVIMTPASAISETFFRLAGEPADDPGRRGRKPHEGDRDAGAPRDGVALRRQGVPRGVGARETRLGRQRREPLAARILG